MNELPGGKAPSLASCLAAETGEGADAASGLSGRLDRYARAKDRALAMVDYISGLRETHKTKKIVAEMRGCGEWLQFRHYLTSNVIRLHGMVSCKRHVLCPLCAIRRGARLLSKYLERVNLVMDGTASLKAYMVTLTIKNGDDLNERYRHLQRSVSALFKTRHGKRQTSEMRKAHGAVYSYEFKRGEGSGQWHPHAHMIVLAETEIDQAALSADWHRITGDSFIVDVHEVYGERSTAFCEVFKYAVKFADLPLSDNYAAAEALRSRRLIGSVGSLFGVVVPDSPLDDPLEEEKYIDLIYRHWRGFGYALAGKFPSPEAVSFPAYEPLSQEARDWCTRPDAG